MLSLIVIILAYILGSISFSYLFGKISKGIDIRKYGSGNAGATNTLRTLGIAPAILVLCLDIAKGVLAVGLGFWASPDQILVPILCGILVIIGHNWPVFFGFRGGKGVATGIGVLGTLCFKPLMLALFVAIIVIILKRYVSLGSLVGAALVPIFILFLVQEHKLQLFVTALIVFLFSAFRHRTNISKLLNGTENKIGKKK